MIYMQPVPPSQIPAAPAPQADCCYCWYVLYPECSYPEQWSSTICDYHSEAIRVAHAARKAARSTREGQA